MTVSVEYHFDFASPNAYLSHKVIPAITARTGASFEYVPVLLGGVFKATNNQPPMVTMQGVKNKPEYQMLEMKRFVAKHGLTEIYRMNPHFPVNTLKIMRGAVAAKSMGAELFERYLDVVFNAMWCEPVKMDDIAVIEQVFRAGDLPADDLLAAMQDPEIKTQLIANTEKSVERGVFGAPSFFVGDELFFGKDSLGAVEEEIVAKSGN